MSEKIFSKEDVNKYLDEEHKVNSVILNIKPTNKLVERAFSELKENDIISGNNYREETITYNTETGENLAISRYAMFEDVAYLSWVWVAKPLRGNNFGTLLVRQTCNQLSNNKISEIYTISKATDKIFDRNGFVDSIDVKGMKVKIL